MISKQNVPHNKKNKPVVNIFISYISVQQTHGVVFITFHPGIVPRFVGSLPKQGHHFLRGNMALSSMQSSQ